MSISLPKTVVNKSGLFFLMILILLLFLFGIYANAFNSSFYLDSSEDILNRTVGHLTNLSWTNILNAMRADYGASIDRPLARLSLAITHYFFGLNPTAYRIGNLFIHFFACLSLFFMFVQVCKSSHVSRKHHLCKENYLFISFVAMLFWAVHPIQTNVVTYVIQRMTSLCGLFSFLSIGAYLKARMEDNSKASFWFMLSGISICLAIGCKDIGLLVVPTLILAELIILEYPKRDRKKAFLCGWGFVFAAAIVFVLMKRQSVVAFFLTESQRYDFTPIQRLMTEIRLQLTYLRILVWPESGILNLDADVALSRGLLSPVSTLVGLIISFFFISLGIIVRKSKPLISFGIAWWFIWQTIEGTIIPLELYYEHRMYIVSVFLYLFIAYGLFFVWVKFEKAKFIGLVFLIGWIGFAGAQTYSRNALWANPEMFWKDAIDKSPNKVRPYTNLSVVLLQSGKNQEAYAILEKAESLDPSNPAVQVNLALLDKQEGRIQSAVNRYNKVIANGKGAVATAYYGLATVSMKDKDYQTTIDYLLKATQQYEAYSDAWNLLGAAYMNLGEVEKSESAIDKALEFDEMNSNAYANKARLAFSKGQYVDAEYHMLKALQLDPQNKLFRGQLKALKDLLDNNTN